LLAAELASFRHFSYCAFVGFFVPPVKQSIPIPKVAKVQFFQIFNKITFKITRKVYKMVFTKLQTP
jgi:hypothetical protein